MKSNILNSLRAEENKTNPNLNVKLYKAVVTKKMFAYFKDQELWIGKKKDGYYIIVTSMTLKGISMYSIIHEDDIKRFIKTLRNENKELVRDINAEKQFKATWETKTNTFNHKFITKEVA